jgi:hypothetical protein
MKKRNLEEEEEEAANEKAHPHEKICVYTKTYERKERLKYEPVLASEDRSGY